MCTAVKNHKRNTKNPYFGDSRSFKVSMLTFLKSASYDKQHVCAYLQLFYARRANIGKITTFQMTTSLTLARAGLLEPRG